MVVLLWVASRMGRTYFSKIFPAFFLPAAGLTMTKSFLGLFYKSI